MNWPIGMGKDFKGVYNRRLERVELFKEGKHGSAKTENIQCAPDDERLTELLGPGLHEKLMEDIELLDIAGDNYDLDEILAGELTPIFFGSALTNFGVEPFLESFLEISKPPLPRHSNEGDIDPLTKGFSGFIFKIQANMNPAHRDRIAFLRICSGKYEKGISVNHVQKGKKIKLAQPQQFLAQDRVIVEEAYAGDIIGLHDPGIFNIGDTLSIDSNTLQYHGMPHFAPEHFMRISTVNALKRKQFVKGLQQLSEEGTIQVFYKPFGATEEMIVGVVGALQFDVLEYRLEREYGVEIRTSHLPHRHIRWIEHPKYDPSDMSLTMDAMLLETEDGVPVVLCQHDWSFKHLTDRNKGLVLHETSTSL